MNKRALTVAAAILTAAFAASAAPSTPGTPDVGTASPAGTIYEWVDDSGSKHASDDVPQKYKGAARRVDASRFRIPATEQEEAQRQAATLKAKAASVAPAPRPESEAARPVAARSASPSAECAARRAQFAASLPCYVYSNPDGSHGFHSCATPVVPDPDSDCGPEGSR
jgi:hypothetical protein